MHSWRQLVIITVLSFAALPTIGFTDTLVIPDISNQPGNAPEDVPRPTRAMTMDQVQAQFGPPDEVLGPVGNPPITRWIYDRFTVHFEGEYVIHSVVRRNQQ